MIADERPDLIILDWMLPGLSGIEVCRLLRAKPETRDSPILMLTARSSSMPSGAGTSTSMSVPSMCMSAGFARRSPVVVRAIRYVRSVVLAILSMSVFQRTEPCWEVGL